MRKHAHHPLISAGWLAMQPADFQAEVMRRSVPQIFAPGAPIYRLGDPPGGIYGLISGRLGITTAPAGAAPRLVHFGEPGRWIGEGPYLTGEPRRVELRATTECAVLALSLDAMEQMTARDPQAARRFGQIPLLNVDLAIRVIHDLLIPDVERRIAAVVLRNAPEDGAAVLASQAELGAMANAPRKRVNLALGRFAAAGWVALSYRAITVLDAEALGAFVASGDEG